MRKITVKDNVSCYTVWLIPAAAINDSSCPDLIRASGRSRFNEINVADAHGSSPWAEGPRVKPGHDDGEIGV
jgi:hypothetical protein